MGRHISLSLKAPAMPKRHRPPRERHFSPISAIDLLSTRTRQVPQLPSSPALTVPTAASGPAPLMRTLVRTLEQHRHRRRRTAASGISGPEWRRGWRREHQLWPWSNAPRIGAASVTLHGSGITHAEPFDSDASRVAWPLTLPVALSRRPGFTQLDRPEPRTLSTDDAPTSPLSRPEVPSASESPSPRSQLALKGGGGAAAGTSALPPRSSVRHAFTRRLYALDPIP